MPDGIASITSFALFLVLPSVPNGPDHAEVCWRPPTERSISGKKEYAEFNGRIEYYHRRTGLRIDEQRVADAHSASTNAPICTTVPLKALDTSTKAVYLIDELEIEGLWNLSAGGAFHRFNPRYPSTVGTFTIDGAPCIVRKRPVPAK